MNQVEAEAVERDRGRVVIRHPPSAALVSSNDFRKAAEKWTVLAQWWRRWSRGRCGQVPALHSLFGLAGVVLRLSVLALWRSKLPADKVCFEFLQLSQ